jgi:hypothetical protein
MPAQYKRKAWPRSITGKRPCNSAKNFVYLGIAAGFLLLVVRSQQFRVKAKLGANTVLYATVSALKRLEMAGFRCVYDSFLAPNSPSRCLEAVFKIKMFFDVFTESFSA